MLYNYYIFFVREEKERIATLTNEKESLYDFMGKLGSAMSERLDLAKIMELIVTSAVNNTGSDAGAAYMVDEYENALCLKAASGLYPPLYPVPDKVQVKAKDLKSYVAETVVKVGETVLGEVSGNRQACIYQECRER